MSTELHNVVADELARAGLVASPEPLCAYLALLERWGRRINLTGRPDAVHIARRLLPDALMLAANLAPEARTVVDVGSGSGIVGLPLTLVRRSLVTLLVEPSGRRCSFLRTAAHALDVDQLTIAEAHLEELELLPRDLAASRATWPPAQWLERALPLVRPGGEALCFLGEQDAPAPPAGFLTPRLVRYRLVDGTPRQLAFYGRP